MPRNKPQKKKAVWSEEEDLTLTGLVNEQLEAFTVTAHNFGRPVSSTRRVKWSKIGQRIPGKTREQCRARWMNNLDPTILRKTEWSEHEDALLLLMGYEIYPKKWNLFSEALPGRSPDQIKARWRHLQRTFHNYHPELEKPLPTNGERNQNQLHFY